MTGCWFWDAASAQAASTRRTNELSRNLMLYDFGMMWLDQRSTVFVIRKILCRGVGANKIHALWTMQEDDRRHDVALT